MAGNQSTLDAIFDEFKQRIVRIDFYQSVAKKICNGELQSLLKQAELVKKNGRESLPIGGRVMACQNIVPNKLIFLGAEEVTIEGQIDAFFHHNRQYQWLLVEAYEAYEAYLIKLYAHLGFFDNSYWAMQDFGGISIAQIQNQDIAWFVQQTKRKKDKPKSILNQIKKKLPHLNQILAVRKKNDPRFHDYEFMIIVIEKLRHIIVHNHGYVHDKEKVIERCLKEASLFNNGSPSMQHVDEINWFFGVKRYENLVSLIELPDPNNSSAYDKYFDRFNELINILSSYALFLHNLTRET